MKQLHAEVLRRFPEVAPHLPRRDEELPYPVVNAIVEWLLQSELTPSLIRRIIDPSS